MAKEKAIRILPAGPYEVTGSVRLVHEVLTHHDDDSYTWEKRRILQEEGALDNYHLCRCGRSTHAPFCSGAHAEKDATGKLFTGEEVAGHDTLEERAGKLSGTDYDLLDDIDLCSQGRFCHTPHGKIWKLLDHEDPEVRARALQGIRECPSGRLVAIVGGESDEPSLEQEIVVSDDPEKGVDGPLYVRGGIPIYDADGKAYEVRNRVALCRCGRSHNMPFCDARHLITDFHADGVHENPPEDA